MMNNVFLYLNHCNVQTLPQHIINRIVEHVKKDMTELLTDYEKHLRIHNNKL